MERLATCACGQLQTRWQGDPVRVGVCHCLACQRRTGSAFGVQAVFLRAQRLAVVGDTATSVRIGDGGGQITFRFCPACGSTVFWELSGRPEVWLVAVGAFADPSFPAPDGAVYEARQHPWVRLQGITHHMD